MTISAFDWYFKLITFAIVSFVILIIITWELIAIFCPIENEEDKLAKMQKKKRSDGSNNKQKMLFLALPMLSYVFYLLCCLLLLLQTIFASNALCQITAQESSSTYSLAKMFMYCVFVFRLKIIYGSSFFAYNNRSLNLLMAVICLYTFGMIIIHQFFIDGFVVSIDDDKSDCGAAWPFGVTEAQTIIDLGANALCCYYFIKPLRFMLKEQKEMPGMVDQEARDEMLFVLRKCVILTVVAVVSTFLILGVLIATRKPTMIAIDIGINCLCIMMFNTKNAKMYRILCFPLTKMTSKCCDHQINKTQQDNSQSV